MDLRKAAGQVIAQSKIEVACPDCGAKNQVLVGDVVNKRHRACRGCGKQLVFNDKGGQLGTAVRGQY